MKSLTRVVIAFSACTALVLTAVAGGPAAVPRDSKDKEVAAVPAPTCPITWSGFYIGIHAGYGWGQADTNVDPLPDVASFSDMAPATLDPKPAGVVGGAQIGYNFQWGHFVLGVETDFSGTGMDGTTTVTPIIEADGTSFGAGSEITVHQDTDWFGTFRLRMGFTPTCRLLLYGTGGLAYGNVNYSANANFLPTGTEQYPVSFSETQVGWTAGAGVEYALTQRWSVKFEYLYYDLGDQSRTANPIPTNPPFQVRYNWQTAAHTVNAGLNFKF